MQLFKKNEGKSEKNKFKKYLVSIQFIGDKYASIILIRLSDKKNRIFIFITKVERNSSR